MASESDITAGGISVSVSFIDFYSRMKGRPELSKLPDVIGLDPGETTGVCLFDNKRFLNKHPTISPSSVRTPSISQFQKNTSIIEWGVDAYNELIADELRDTVVVIESYRIYSWRTKQHTWAPLLTPRLIGCAETLCRLKGVPLVQQSAQVGKGFVTDDRLKAWGLYIPGKPHAMDATRHVCQFLLFSEFK